MAGNCESLWLINQILSFSSDGIHCSDECIPSEAVTSPWFASTVIYPNFTPIRHAPCLAVCFFDCRPHGPQPCINTQIAKTSSAPKQLDQPIGCWTVGSTNSTTSTCCPLHKRFSRSSFCWSSTWSVHLGQIDQIEAFAIWQVVIRKVSQLAHFSPVILRQKGSSCSTPSPTSSARVSRRSSFLMHKLVLNRPVRSAVYTVIKKIQLFQ